MAQERQALRLADLAAGETPLSPDEAVALTLAVAERLGWSEPPLDPEIVVVRGDGTVHLPRLADAGPATPRQYAELLHRLLALGHGTVRPGVPGPLLLLIARARGEIDLPAFASADEFRLALLRLLPRPGAHVIAAAMGRWRPAPSQPTRATRAAERRVTGPRVDELRRMLRDSDLERLALLARLRQHEAAARLRQELTAPPTQDASAGPATRRARDTPGVIAAGLAALSITAGGLFWTSSRGTWSGAAPATADASHHIESRARPVMRTDAGAANAARARATNQRGRREASWSARAGTRIDAPSMPAAGDNAQRPVLEDGARQTSVRRPAPVATRADTKDIAPAGPAAGSPEAPRNGGREMAVRDTLQTLPVAAPTAYSPSFSPDGASVYFHAGGREGSRLMRADTDDRGDVREVATIVDDGAQNFHVRLSPDGSRVAFDSDRDGVRGVYVAGRDGTNVRRVSGPGYAAVPVWSPDGRQLLYVRAEPRAPRTWNLWRLSLDSGTQRQLTRHPYGQAWPGSWFGDGQQICYTHEDRMHVLDLRTGGSQSITSPVAGRLVRTAAVSPDGTYVVFQVHRDGMWLLDLRDRSMRRVLDDPTAEEFTWSPDGRRVAFHSRRQGHWGVWVMASPS